MLNSSSTIIPVNTSGDFEFFLFQLDSYMDTRKNRVGCHSHVTEYSQLCGKREYDLYNLIGTISDDGLVVFSDKYDELLKSINISTRYNSPYVLCGFRLDAIKSFNHRYDELNDTYEGLIQFENGFILVECYYQTLK